MHIAFGWSPLKQFYPGLNGVWKMTGRTEAGVAKKLLSQIESVNLRLVVASGEFTAMKDELAFMREMILGVLREAAQPVIELQEETMQVSWRYGKFRFPKNGVVQYKILDALNEAGPEGLSHAELAEKVYGNDIANVSRCAERLGKKLEKYGCPKRVEKDSRKVWLTDAW